MFEVDYIHFAWRFLSNLFDRLSLSKYQPKYVVKFPFEPVRLLFGLSVCPSIKSYHSILVSEHLLF